MNFNSYLRLEGLDPKKKYLDESAGRILSGDTLMNAGLNLSRNYRDGESVLIHLKEVKA